MTGLPRLRKWSQREPIGNKSWRKSDKSARKPAKSTKKKGIASRQNIGLRRSNVSANKKSKGVRMSWPSS